MRLFLFLLLLPTMAMAVPQPIRDTAHDWRCVNPDGTATNHQRQDTAIYACQTRAEANPGQTYYIEGGRYRVTVAGSPPPFTPDLTYTTTTPSGDSIHPLTPAGSTAEVEILSGTGVQVLSNGSTMATSNSWSVVVRTRTNGVWSSVETITWQ